MDNWDNWAITSDIKDDGKTGKKKFHVQILAHANYFVILKEYVVSYKKVDN